MKNIFHIKNFFNILNVAELFYVIFVYFSIFFQWLRIKENLLKTVQLLFVYQFIYPFIFSDIIVLTYDDREVIFFHTTSLNLLTLIESNLGVRICYIKLKHTEKKISGQIHVFR